MLEFQQSLVMHLFLEPIHALWANKRTTRKNA